MEGTALVEIHERLQTLGYDVGNLAWIGNHPEAYRVAAPMILDVYPELSPQAKFSALVCLQARIPSAPLGRRFYELLLSDDMASLGLTEQYCAGKVLVGLAGRNRELILAYAGDHRLDLARHPSLIALAKRRDLKVVPLIQQALHRPEARATAVEAIGLMRLHAFAPAVHDALHSSDPTEQDAAQKALKRLHDGKT